MNETMEQKIADALATIGLTVGQIEKITHSRHCFEWPRFVISANIDRNTVEEKRTMGKN